jgi:hypothetical protein
MHSTLEEETMRRIIKRTTALAVLIAAFAVISAPGASARFDLNPPRANDSAQVAAPAPTTTVTDSSSGFGWGSAAIGAGVMLGLIAVGGGTLMVSRRGQDRTRPVPSS